MRSMVCVGTCGACTKFEFPDDKYWRSRIHAQHPGRCQTTEADVYRDQPKCAGYECRLAGGETLHRIRELLYRVERGRHHSQAT
jgi:hypothetical protein